MGAQRIQEVTMFALLFLLLGILLLLAAAGRIWIDPAPVDSPVIDSAVSNSSSESVTLRQMPAGKDLVV
jgi:hypothetical protein